MKIAYSNLSSPEWSMEEVFRYGADFGFDGVEIRLLDGNVIPSTLETETRDTIKRLSAASGVKIVGLGASTRFATHDASIRRNNVEELLRYIDLAHELEVPLVRTFGGGVKPGCESTWDAVRYVAEGLNEVAKHAEEAGVTVALETHDEFSHSAMVKDVMLQVESPAIGVIWDVHHPYRMGETVEETWGNLRDRLVHVHLKDARRKGEDWELVVFGEGEVPVRQVVRKMMEENYNGVLCVEWERKWHPEIEDAKTALPKHMARLREYLA